jgi:hypothetical protein
MPPVLRRKVVLILGRSPGSREAFACKTAFLPQLKLSGVTSGIPLLQWRDRVGVAPNFPIKP